MARGPHGALGWMVVAGCALTSVPMARAPQFEARCATEEGGDTWTFAAPGMALSEVQADVVIDGRTVQSFALYAEPDGSGWWSSWHEQTGGLPCAQAEVTWIGWGEDGAQVLARSTAVAGH